VQGIFVGTFLIGLREGLEASLIVGIVGAFLARNGRSVRPMIAGVTLAVAISIAVGVGLDLLSTSLPQRQQEMLETVIGAIAVVFVTTMIIWMNRHAMAMKGELEREAAQALNAGGSLALTGMAFLAVLKEGFETSVFLLAAAQTSSGSRWYAVLGGAAGIAVAVAIGVGLYYGGLKLNLGRFFRVTGVFLVLIAAGLVMSALRTAHEAGWVTIGQQRVLDLSSWFSAKSVLGALVTGMFGIPNDPRLIEVLGWLLYAVPVLGIFLWPARLVPSARVRTRLLVASAVVLGVAATVLAVFVPTDRAVPDASTRQVTDGNGHSLTVSLVGNGQIRDLTLGDRKVALNAAGAQEFDGVGVDVWQAKTPADAGQTATTITRGQLADLTGGRLPVGLNAARTPGPFDVQWNASTVYTARTNGGNVVGADAGSNRTATLSGGGLTAPKTVSVGGLGSDWATSEADDRALAAQIAQSAHDHAERTLWTRWVPTVLVIASTGLLLVAARGRRKSSKSEREQQNNGEASELEKPEREEFSVS
jgi:high-affinity iron transporter